MSHKIILQMTCSDSACCMSLHRKVEGDIEVAVINKWYVTVERMRGDIEKWTLRQSKHASHGWPLVTLLTCLLDNSRFLSHIEGLVDTLHRQLKV